MRRIAQFGFLLGLLSLTSACFVEQPRDGYGDREHTRYYREEPHEGYWDRDHARYYHEHQWRECREDERYCR
jgi:hypothetical protein